MADSNTNVLTIDTGGAITNLKEFKKHLDDLKGVLLGLEKGTDDYKKVADELRVGQQKLNDVMYEARKNSEAVEGSYDALVAKMRDLKKEWRATADETKRADLGRQILGINDQLKALDASTGNFQRNVGDYKNAFAEVFDKMLGPLGKVNGTLGVLARDVKGMIPLIKQVSTTATAGLKGIKAAIASTGIGLLVIAVGELAANWEKVLDWVNKNITAQGRLNDAIEKNKQATLELAQKLIATYREESDEYQRLNAMLAGEDMGRYAYKKRLIKVSEEHKEATRLEGIAIDNYNKAVDQRVKAEKALSSLSVLATDNSRAAAEAALSAAKATEEAAKRERDAAHKNTQQATANIKLVQGELNTYDRIKNKSAEENAKASEKTTKATDAEREAAQALVETIRKSSLDEYDAKEEEYENNIALLEKYKEQGYITEEELVNSKKILWNNYVAWLNDKLKESDKAIKDNALQQAQDWKDYIEEYKKGMSDLSAQNEQEVDRWLGYADKEYTRTVGIGEAFQNLFNPSKLFAFYDEGKKRIGEWRESNDEIHNNLVKSIDDELATLDSGSTRYKELTDLKIAEDQRYFDEVVKINEEEDKLEEERSKKKSAIMQARMQMVQIGIQTTANLLTNLANLQEQQIQDDVKNGKISEKEAKKKFKTVKNMQYAAAVMETAQAAMGAYSALASIPYVGPALGIAAAAAAVAQGLVQIKQIQKTKFEATGSASGGDVSTPDMSSVANEYTPTYAQNMQTNSELTELSNAVGNMQPVVQVVDIESGLNTVKVRDTESTY